MKKTKGEIELNKHIKAHIKAVKAGQRIVTVQVWFYDDENTKMVGRVKLPLYEVEAFTKKIDKRFGYDIEMESPAINYQDWYKDHLKFKRNERRRNAYYRKNQEKEIAGLEAAVSHMSKGYGLVYGNHSDESSPITVDKDGVIKFRRYTGKKKSILDFFKKYIWKGKKDER